MENLAQYKETIQKKSLHQLVNDCHKAVNGLTRLTQKQGCGRLTPSECDLQNLYIEREELLREEFLLRVYNLTDLDCHEGIKSDDLHSEAFIGLEKRYGAFDDKLWVMADGWS